MMISDTAATAIDRKGLVQCTKAIDIDELQSPQYRWTTGLPSTRSIMWHVLMITTIGGSISIIIDYLHYFTADTSREVRSMMSYVVTPYLQCS